MIKFTEEQERAIHDTASCMWLSVDEVKAALSQASARMARNTTGFGIIVKRKPAIVDAQGKPIFRSNKFQSVLNKISELREFDDICTNAKLKEQNFQRMMFGQPENNQCKKTGKTYHKKDRLSRLIQSRESKRGFR